MAGSQLRRAGAEVEVGAGNLLQHERHVLGAGLGVDQPLVTLLAEDLGGGGSGELGLGDVVDDRGIAALEVHVDVEAVCRRDAAHDFGRAANQLLAGRRRERAQRSGELGRRRDDIVDRAGVELADGEHDRVEDVESAGHHGLQGQHHLARRRDRVAGAERGRAVPAGAAYPHLAGVVGGAEDAPAAEDQPARKDGGHMQAVRRHGRLAGRGEQPFRQHRLRAAGTLLARLEHEDHIARQLVPGGAEQPGRADEDRGVQVVATGVHRARDRRRVRQARLLGHRQRVHVAAQQHRRAWPAAPQHRDDRAERAPGADLQWQVGQLGEHRRLGLGQVQAHLRSLVQPPAQVHQLSADRLRGLPELHRAPFSRRPT